MTTDCNDRCTACGAHLDMHGHFEGCGNAYPAEREKPVSRPKSGFVIACMPEMSAPSPRGSTTTRSTGGKGEGGVGGRPTPSPDWRARQVIVQAIMDHSGAQQRFAERDASAILAALDQAHLCVAEKSGG